MLYLAPSSNTLSKGFIQGTHKYSKRSVMYNSLYNEMNANSLNYSQVPIKDCKCHSENYNKNMTGSSAPTNKKSYRMRISHTVNTYLGGKLQYGNFYMNQPMQLNYFGRIEGMPGGFGSPPLNKF